MQLPGRQILHQLSYIRELRISGPHRPGIGAFRGIDHRVVPDHGFAVFGDDDVEFEGADPQLEGFGEGAQRLFGGLSPPAAVRLQVEGFRVLVAA
ncbi:Uncharacterised protein [Mycobacteroides abscessus subsp. abscessus]|nr:Uncharacterised protein [Mycobacteroides abscessus subsp. abscessus]